MIVISLQVYIFSFAYLDCQICFKYIYTLKNNVLKVFLCDIPNYYKSDDVKLFLGDLLVKIILYKKFK